MRFFKNLFVISTIAILSYPSFSQNLEVESPLYQENSNHIKAEELKGKNDLVNARIFYEAALDDFEKEGQWRNYARAVNSYVYAFNGKEGYSIGMDSVNNKMNFLIENSPENEKYLYNAHYGLGYLHCYAYDIKEAIKSFKKSYQLLKIIDPEENYRYYTSIYCGLGIAYRDGIHVDSSLSYFLKSEEICLKHKDDKPWFEYEIAKTYEHLGYHYYLIGDYEKAISITKEGLEYAIQASGENFIQNTWFYANLAEYYKNMGEYELSLDHYSKVVHIIESQEEFDAFMQTDYLPGIFSSMSINYQELSDSINSIKYIKKAEKIIKYQKEDEYTMHAVYSSYSNHYSIFNDQNKSNIYLEKIDSILKVYPENLKEYKNRYLGKIISNKFSLITNNIALENYESAEKSLNEILGMVSNDRILKQNLLPHIYSNFSDLNFAQNNIDSAIIYNQKSFLANCLDCTNIEDIYKPNQKFSSNKNVFNNIDLMLSYIIKNEDIYSDEEKISNINVAFKLLTLGENIHLSNLKKMSSLRGNENSNIIRDIVELYKKGIAIVYQKYEITRSKKDLNIAFNYIQKMKAQKLLLSSQKSEAKILSAVPEEIIEQEKQFQLDILFYEKKILDAENSSDSELVQEYKSNFLLPKQIMYNNFIINLEKEFPEYYQNKYQLKYPNQKDIVNCLSPNELLVEYLIPTDSTMYVYTCDSKDNITFDKVAFTNGETISKFKNLIKKTSLIRNKNKQKFIDYSYALYNQFINPISNQLEGKNKIILIGDNLTHYIPFESLIESNKPDSYSNLNYLINKYEVSYHYSSTLFKEARDKAETFDDSFYAFAPVYDQDNSPELKNTWVRSDTTLRAIQKDGVITSLPESEKEVKEISKIFKSFKSNHINLRIEANEESLKRNLTKGYKYIHIAGHSFANTKNPLFSGIVCFDDKDDINDGILYTGEISQLNISADLLTLSSCESGLGKLDNTDGLLGLNRAFIQSGVRNVVFSLWKVIDKTSADLMIDFYSEIHQKKTYSEALRKAKLKMIADETTASPNLWSAFLLIGG